ncbi:MAG TPA: trigger factor [Thermoleophilaceae bacterium]|nr:trigger factor [Thermoleophilaceae bacterium]
MAAVKTSTTELGDSRVRVEVEVATEALERELESAAGAIGREMRVPGFRKGKVPPQVVIRQVGRQAVLDEAVRRALPGWYEEALHDAGVAAVGDPKVDLSDLPEQGAPLAFSIEVGVIPEAELGDYKGVEAGRREPEVKDDEVDAELERLRESLASLETVDRAAEDGDFLVLDYVGKVDGEPFEGGEARGYLLELGSGRLIPGFEEQLGEAQAGEKRQVEVTFPDDYPAEELAGKQAVFEVEVKEVKQKRLPELDDDFAVEAGGYDTLAELREEIAGRLRDAEERSIEGEFREAAVDAVVAQAKLDVPHELVHEKAHEMWHRTARRLAAQGVDPRRYLELSGKTEEELVKEAEPDAELALKREAVLSAVVKREGIEVSGEEVEEALRQAVEASAGGREVSEKQLKRALKRARSQGAEDALREDIAMRKAVDLVVEHARPIPVDQARAREKLWTPEKEGKEKAGKIWTPGS